MPSVTPSSCLLSRVSYPYQQPSRLLEQNLVPLLCELSSLSNHTEGCLASSRLPAPQSQAHSEEQIIVLALPPRFKRHIARGDVGSALVVLEFVHQSISILDLADPDLPLLEGSHGREDEVLLRHRPIAIRPGGSLESRLRACHADTPKVHTRHSLRRSASALELSIQHIHYATPHPGTIYRERHLS